MPTQCRLPARPARNTRRYCAMALHDRRYFFQASQPTQTKKTTVMTTKMMKAMSSGVDMALASSVQRQQRAEHVEGQFAQQEREIQQSDRHDDARDHHLLLPSNQGASNQGASNRDRGRGRPKIGKASCRERVCKYV